LIRAQPAYVNGIVAGTAMRQISSKMTWWHKKALPSLFFGIIVLVSVQFVAAVINGSVPGEVLWIPLGMTVFGLLMMGWLVFPLMDEVWIDGDDLIVRNWGEEERVPITQIIDVKSSFLTSPESIGITLEPPSRFGKWIRFAAPFRTFPFGTHPLARELADRSGCFDRRR
jgi:hypothetical protein